MLKPRYRAFLEELPRNGNKVIPSAIKAGYSPKYARARGKTLMNNALKQSARDIVKSVEDKEMGKKEAQRLMYEIVGFTPQEVLNNVKYLATQEKDLATRFRVIAPFAKELGVLLNVEDEKDKNTVPILNITVEKKADIIDGNVIPNEVSQELKNG